MTGIYKLITSVQTKEKKKISRETNFVFLSDFVQCCFNFFFFFVLPQTRLSTYVPSEILQQLWPVSRETNVTELETAVCVYSTASVSFQKTCIKDSEAKTSQEQLNYYKVPSHSQLKTTRHSQSCSIFCPLKATTLSMRMSD